MHLREESEDRDGKEALMEGGDCGGPGEVP